MKDRGVRELDARREQAERAQKGPDTIYKAKARLYDKIKARVSVRTMDIIIWTVAALIVAALIVGIAMGN